MLVDIVYAKLSARGKALVDISGHLALLTPSLLILLYWSWPMMARAWAIRDAAISVGGIPALFLLKTQVPAFRVLWRIQGLSAPTRGIIRFRQSAPHIEPTGAAWSTDVRSPDRVHPDGLPGCLYHCWCGDAVCAVGVRLDAFPSKLMIPGLTQAVIVTSMIFVTILMASFFSSVVVGLGGEHRVSQSLEHLPGGATGALIFVMRFVLILGFFLDFVEISVILLPLVIPPLILMGHDLSRGRAVHFLQAVAIAIIWFLPLIATWLPRWAF